MKNQYKKYPRKPIRKVVKSFVRKKIPLTVCIAAIYNYDPNDIVNHPGSIIGVSDRMITSFDIEFEPETEKIIPATRFIAVMTAGDAGLQTELFYKISSIINERIKSIKSLLPVYEVARYYSSVYRQIKKELAERKILFPLGLNYQSFIKRQKEMSPEFVDHIIYLIENFRILDSNGESRVVSTIIAGMDEKGPHIFVVNDDSIEWSDRIGFAAIGSGKFHAEAHLELVGQTPKDSETQTLINIHTAKKKSEVSPGVGKETDMFVLGLQYGFQLLKPLPNGVNIVGYLNEEYEKYKQEIEKLEKSREPTIQQYIIDLNKQSPTSADQKSAQVQPSVGHPNTEGDIIKVNEKDEAQPEEKRGSKTAKAKSKRK